MLGTRCREFLHSFQTECINISSDLPHSILCFGGACLWRPILIFLFYDLVTGSADLQKKVAVTCHLVALRTRASHLSLLRTNGDATLLLKLGNQNRTGCCQGQGQSSCPPALIPVSLLTSVRRHTVHCSRIDIIGGRIPDKLGQKLQFDEIVLFSVETGPRSICREALLMDMGLVPDETSLRPSIRPYPCD